MLRWFTDLHTTSKRVVSYFVPRDEVMFRVGRVMQTEQALYLACHKGLTDWQTLFEALGVVDLTELDDATYLILDDCDTLDSQTLAALINTLLQETRCLKLVLFARRPLIDLYADPMIAPAYQCYVGATLIDSPYDHEDKHIVLYVESFGQGRVFANGQLIEEWSGPQAMETLFVMLDLMPVSTETLLLALFESTSDEAYNRFHVNKTYINRALEQDLATLGASSQARQHIYYLSKDITLRGDFQNYCTLMKQILNQSATSETILSRSIELVQFPYREYVGQIPDNVHLKGRRQQVRYYLSQALVQVGYHVWRKGDFIQAEALFARSTIVDRTNREPVDALMALYRQQGHNQEAAAVYRRWQDAQSAASV